jgi:hypothetical protein
MTQPICMKLGMYIMANGKLHWTFPSILPILQPLMLECLYQSSLNFVCISCHMSPSQWRTSDFPPISITNTAASKITAVITLILIVWIDHHKTWYIYYTTWAHFNDVLHTFLISNANTAASKILEAITLVLLECLNRLSWNLVYTSILIGWINEIILS